MSTHVEELGPCRRKLSVTIDAERVDAAIGRSYAEIRSTVSIPGFRRGRAPRGILEKRFGEHVMHDVKQELIVEGIQEGIKENELEVVSDPSLDPGDIELIPGEPLSFSVEFEVRPDFELPAYSGIEVKRVVAPVSDEDVAEVLESLRGQQASWVPMEDGAAEVKDLIHGHLTLKDGDDVVFERDTGALVGEDEQLSQIPVEGLQEKLEGARPDDEIELEVDVPEDYPVTDLRGRRLSATLVVREIKRMELPEVDDDFAGHFDCDDVAALDAKIRENLKERNEAQADARVEDAIIDAIIEQTDFPLPEATLEKTLEGKAREVLLERLMRGEAPDDIEEARAELREELRPNAERSIRAWYVMEKIAKKEKIFATETDFNQRVEALAAQQRSTPTAVREEIAKNDAADGIRASILEQKVRKWLTDEAKIVEEPGGASAESGSAE